MHARGLAMAARGPQVLLLRAPAVAAVLDGDESAASVWILPAFPMEPPSSSLPGGCGEGRRVIVSGSCDGTVELVTTRRVLRVPIGAGDAVPVTVELHDGRATAVELRSLALVLPGLPPLMISRRHQALRPFMLLCPRLQSGSWRAIEWDYDAGWHCHPTLASQLRAGL